MVKKILGILTGPFFIALAAILLLAAGGVAGMIIADKMDAAEKLKKKLEKEAAEAAARGPLPPQLVREEPDGSDPFEPIYIDLGAEIMANLPGKGRAIIVDISLMTRRGEDAESLIKRDIMPLRALTLGIISELSLETATSPDGAKILSERLLAAMNSTFRANYNIAPIDAVLMKRFYVQ